MGKPARELLGNLSASHSIRHRAVGQVFRYPETLRNSVLEVTPKDRSSVGSPDGGPKMNAESFTQAEIEEFKQRDVLFGVAFAKIVSLMMRSPAHKGLHLSDLTWLVVPPLLADQFAIVEAVRDDEVLPSPYAATLWAMVSPEVDRRLSEDKDKSVRLAVNEWQSGDILWIIDAVGYPEIVPAFLEEFVATHFPGQHPKIRVMGMQGIAEPRFVGLDDLKQEPRS